MSDAMALLVNYLVVGGLLFALGMIGFIARRNMIVMFLCVEMMLQGVAVSVVGWGKYHGDWGGQMLVIFMIAVAAAEAGLAMALILMLYQQSGTLDVAFWQELREDGQQAFVDREVPEDLDTDQVWPTLTPSGIEPELDPKKELHRSRV